LAAIDGLRHGVYAGRVKEFFCLQGPHEGGGTLVTQEGVTNSVAGVGYIYFSSLVMGVVMLEMSNIIYISSAVVAFPKAPQWPR
jgi:hypothetical protein